MLKRLTIFRHPNKNNLNGKIITDIYQKPTDTQQYLHLRSHHLKNGIKSIPYTLARIIDTIITDKNVKKIRLKELHTTRHQRRYPTTLINKGLELAENTSKTFKEPEKHSNEKPLAYVATYNKNNPKLFTEIMKNLEEIENEEKIKEIRDTEKIIKSYR